MGRMLKRSQERRGPNNSNSWWQSTVSAMRQILLTQCCLGVFDRHEEEPARRRVDCNGLIVLLVKNDQCQSAAIFLSCWTIVNFNVSPLVVLSVRACVYLHMCL